MFGFSAMNRMRINGQLCDVKLKSGMVVVQAHKLVLAAVSPYFHAMFNGKCPSESFKLVDKTHFLGWQMIWPRRPWQRLLFMMLIH